MSESFLINGVRLGEHQMDILYKLFIGYEILSYLSIDGNRKNILKGKNRGVIVEENLTHRDILRLLSKGTIKVSHSSNLDGGLIMFYVSTDFANTIFKM